MSSTRVQVLLLLILVTSRGLGADSEMAVRMVPFQRAPSPYVVIPVPIKGRGCASLLFDTGTNLSILGPDLAARLRLLGGKTLTVASAAGETTAETGVVSGIGFELTQGDTPSPVVTTDVTMLRELVGNVSGIFGQSLLGRSDYFIDYKARRLTLGPEGALNPGVTGTRLALEWSEGRPAISVALRMPSGAASVPVRLVLDSGIDRVTMFGGAARRLAAVAAASSMVTIEGPLGTTRAPAASVVISAGDRDKVVTATLMVDVLDRHEDGLLPTSLFRSVFVGVANGVVVLDGVLRAPAVDHPSAGPTCAN